MAGLRHLPALVSVTLSSQILRQTMTGLTRWQASNSPERHHVPPPAVAAAHLPVFNFCMLHQFWLTKISAHGCCRYGSQDWALVGRALSPAEPSP